MLARGPSRNGWIGPLSGLAEVDLTTGELGTAERDLAKGEPGASSLAPATGEYVSRKLIRPLEKLAP